MGKSKLSLDNYILSTDKDVLQPVNASLSVALILLQVAKNQLQVLIISLQTENI
jgi:hypothetical protein